MPDRLFIQIKVGDLNAKDPSRNMMDGMIIDYNDEEEWGKEIVHPRFSKQAFAILEIDRKYKPLIKEQLGSVSEGTRDYRKRKGLFVLDDFKPLISTDIVNKWRGKDETPIIDMRGADLSRLIKLSSDYDGFSAIDKNLVTAGNYTVGSGGGFNYLTLSAADADTGALTGAIKFTVSSDITETAAADWRLAGNGFGLTLDSDSPHGGDPTVGHLVSIGHGGTRAINYFLVGTSTNEFKNIRLKRTVAGATNTRVFEAITGTNNIHDFIIDGNSLNGGGILTQGGSGRFSNFIIYAFNNNAITAIGTQFWENALLLANGGIGFNGVAQPNTCQNISSFNNGTDFSGVSGSTGNNNADSDGTGADGNWSVGANNNPSLTPANEMELAIDANLGLPKDGGTVKESGIAPTYVSDDMSSVTYASPYPTGPKMFVPAGGGKLVNSGIATDGLINGRLVA